MLVSIFFAITYYTIRQENEYFLKYAAFSFSISTGHVFNEINANSNLFNLAQIVHKFIIGISFPILICFIFHSMINIQPKIIFPQKLIIRRASCGNIVLSILLGNKEYERNKYLLYDVDCKIKYSFAVDAEKRYIRNAATQLESNTSVLIGFYRFSFDISKFSSSFIKSILSQNTGSLMDTLMFTISGRFGPWNSNFIVSKVYQLSNVCIASNYKDIYEETISDGRINEIFTWENMNEIVYYNTDEETCIRDCMKKNLLMTPA